MSLVDEEKGFLNQIFNLLAHEDRREAIAYLKEREEEEVELWEIAAHLRENNNSGGNPGSTLYHRHLPKMDELDLIDYDPVIGPGDEIIEGTTVTYHGDPAVEELVEKAEELEEDFGKY